MKAFIYRCSKKPDMYIYLAEEDDFSKVPKEIFNSLGIISFSMELEMHADRKLSKEYPEKVMENLNENGFHLQLPDETPIEELMNKIANKKL